jgi:NADPH-dependent 2,4-dienoyl-CoA reductase/sulfur reductase-like enzyme
MTGRGKGQRIVVVGGSAAGAAAAARAKRFYPNASVVLFEAGPYVSFGACELPFYLSGEIESLDRLQLYTPRRLAEEKKIKVFAGTRVSEIDRSRQRIMLDISGPEKKYSYDKLIIATGASSVSLLKTYGNFNNVFSLKNLVDGDNIRKYIAERIPAKAVILGAGYIALEIAEALKNTISGITFLNIEEYPLPGYAMEARAVMKEAVTASGMEYRIYREVEDIRRSDGMLQALRIGGEWLEADIFIEAMGIRPNSGIAGKSGILLNKNGTIKTDRYMKTNSANIFAAGDVTAGKHLLTGKDFYLPLGQTANVMGRAAAANLFRLREEVPLLMGTTALKFGGIEWSRTGLTREEAEKYFSNVNSLTFSTSNRPEIMPAAGKIFWHIVFQQHNHRLLGATLWGAPGTALRINTLALAIRAGMTAEQLADGDFLYSPEFSPLLDGFLVLSRLLGRG